MISAIREDLATTDVLVDPTVAHAPMMSRCDITTAMSRDDGTCAAQVLSRPSVAISMRAFVFCIRVCAATCVWVALHYDYCIRAIRREYTTTYSETYRYPVYSAAPPAT